MDGAPVLYRMHVYLYWDPYERRGRVMMMMVQHTIEWVTRGWIFWNCSKCGAAI